MSNDRQSRGGGFRKNRDKLHSFGELASIVYRIATEPLLNPIRS